MLKRLLTIYGIINRTFGFTVKPLLTFWVIASYKMFAAITFALDNVVFPGHRERKIDRPVFIVGNPRSGTTFMHRFLLDQGDLCAFQLWQMIMPSLLGQKLLGPFIPALAKLNPAKHHGSQAHVTGLDAIETDDVALFFKFFDGVFLYGYFLAWDEQDHTYMYDQYKPGTELNRRDMSYYREILKRNLHRSGKARVLGKTFTFTLRPETVLEYFPDAKMIYMARDPKSVIPSGMNMLTNVLEKQYQISKLDPAVRERYYERLYQGLCHLYRSFHDAYVSGRIPKENVMVVRFPDMMQKLEETMDRVVEFAELDVSDAFRQQILETAEKQRQRVSKHKYSLEQFGLTPERIERDLDFFYETFDL